MSTKSIFLALASLCLPCFGQWHGTAWERLRWGTNDTPVVTQIWATAHSVIVTNYVTNGAVLVTNRFISDIYFDQWTTNGVTNSTTITAYSNGIATPWTYVYTNVLVATNVSLQPREVMAYDCYFAMLERMRAITNEEVARSTIASFPRVFRNERESLEYVKTWIETWCGRFVRADLAGTNRDDYTDYYKAHPANTAITFQVSSLLDAFPTNYLDETPWRELSPVSTGFYRIATCNIYFAQSGVTQFVNCCGQTVVTNGVTNNQTATLVCTNAALWANAGTGYTEAASSTWGWRGITNIFNLLVHTTSGGCGAGDGAGNSEVNFQEAYYDLDSGPPCLFQADADAAINVAYSNQTTALCGGIITNIGQFLYASAEFCDIGLYPKYYAQGNPFTLEYTAFAMGSGSLLRHHVGTGSTNISHIADLYVSVSTNAPFPYDTATNFVFQYDDYGQSFTTNKTIFGSVTASGNVTNAVLIGDDPTALQPVPAKPSVGPTLGGFAVRGYDAPKAFWIIRWNVTNGFRYK